MAGERLIPAATIITIYVNGAGVKMSNSFNLLRITFDSQFTVRRYMHTLAREARSRAGCVARLTQHCLKWATVAAAWEWSVDGQVGTLPTCRGADESAWLSGDNLGGVGTGPSCREQRGLLCCWTQEGGPHHHRGPAGGSKVLVTQSAGCPGHGPVSMECLLQQRRHWRHKEPCRQLDVWQCEPATNGKTKEVDNGRGGLEAG
jgi:hypothetical protein